MADAAPTGSPSDGAPAVAVNGTSPDLDASPPPRAPRDDLGMLAPAPAPRPSLTDDERPSPRSVRFADEESETQPGDRVFALFERNRCWGGTVVKTTGNEENLRLDVVFDDGEEQSVFASDVLAAPPHQPESIGPNAKARARVAEAARIGGWRAPDFDDDDAPPPKKRGRPPKSAEAAPAPKKKRGRPKKADFAARDRVKVVEHAKYQGRLGTVVKQNAAWIEVCLDARFPGDAVTSAFRKKDLVAAAPADDDDDDLISDDGHDEALVGRRVGIPITKGGGFGVVERVTDGMCEVTVEGDGFDVGGKSVNCHIGELTLADGGPPTPVAPGGSPRKPASKPRGRKPASVPDDAAAFRARQDARRAAQAAQDSPSPFKPVAPEVPAWPTGDATPPPPPPPPPAAPKVIQAAPPPPPPPPPPSTAPILVRTAGGRSATVIEKKQRGWFVCDLDGNANDEGKAFERKSIRRPHGFMPGQDHLLDSAPQAAFVPKPKAPKAPGAPKPAGRKSHVKQTAPGPVPEGAVQARTLGGRVAIVLERKQRGWFAVELDGNANDEGEAYERKPLRRPQFAPGQDALLDSAPESEGVKAVAAQKAADGKTPKQASKPRAKTPAAEGAPPTMKKQSGYLYHCAQNREAAKAAVAAAQPDLNAQEQNQAVMKRLGEMWGALDAAAKQKCADDAPMVAVKPKKPKAKRSTAPAPAAAPAPAKAAEPFDDDETLDALRAKAKAPADDAPPAPAPAPKKKRGRKPKAKTPAEEAEPAPAAAASKPAAPDEAPCSQDTVPRSQDALEPDALEAVLPTPTPATRPKPNALEPYEAAAAKSSSKPAAAKPSKKPSSRPRKRAASPPPTREEPPAAEAAAPAPALTREEPPAEDATVAPPPRKRAKSPLNDEVAAVLHDAGLRQYYEPFVENEIDVLAIPALEREEWAELGVPLGHRARIKQAHKNRHPEMWARRDSEVQ